MKEGVIVYDWSREDFETQRLGCRRVSCKKKFLTGLKDEQELSCREKRENDIRQVCFLKSQPPHCELWVFIWWGWEAPGSLWLLFWHGLSSACNLTFTISSAKEERNRVMVPLSSVALMGATAKDVGHLRDNRSREIEQGWEEIPLCISYIPEMNHFILWDC